jgi:hypothetical protein
VAFVAALPRSLVFYELGGQLLASGTSTKPITAPRSELDRLPNLWQS